MTSTYQIEELVYLAIPEELSLTYPVKEHKQLLMRYFFIAFKYEHPYKLHSLLNKHWKVWNIARTHVELSNLGSYSPIPEFISMDLDILRPQAEALMSLYGALTWNLDRIAETLHNLNLNIPDTVNIELMNYLSDYCSCRIDKEKYPLTAYLNEHLNTFSIDFSPELEAQALNRAITGYNSFLEQIHYYSMLDKL